MTLSELRQSHPVFFKPSFINKGEKYNIRNIDGVTYLVTTINIPHTYGNPTKTSTVWEHKEAGNLKRIKSFDGFSCRDNALMYLRSM